MLFARSWWGERTGSSQAHQPELVALPFSTASLSRPSCRNSRCTTTSPTSCARSRTAKARTTTSNYSRSTSLRRLSSSRARITAYFQNHITVRQTNRPHIPSLTIEPSPVHRNRATGLLRYGYPPHAELRFRPRALRLLTRLAADPSLPWSTALESGSCSPAAPTLLRASAAGSSSSLPELPQAVLAEVAHRYRVLTVRRSDGGSFDCGRQFARVPIVPHRALYRNFAMREGSFAFCETVAMSLPHGRSSALVVIRKVTIASRG